MMPRNIPVGIAIMAGTCIPSQMMNIFTTPKALNRPIIGSTSVPNPVRLPTKRKKKRIIR